MKKCISMALALVVLFSAMILPMQVSAATTIKSGKAVSVSLSNKKNEELAIQVGNDGKLTANIDTDGGTYIWVYDASGKQITPSKRTKVSKYGDLGSDNKGYYFVAPAYMDDGRGVANFEYTVKKSTYKIVFNQGTQKACNVQVTATFPEAKTESSNDTKPTAAIMTLSLKSGASLQLGTELPSDAKATWKTNDKSVATISSSGKVTTVSKGSATITATTGNTVLKIKVIVS